MPGSESAFRECPTNCMMLTWPAAEHRKQHIFFTLKAWLKVIAKSMSPACNFFLVSFPFYFLSRSFYRFART